MDEDDRELIVRLCSQAGAMMEDASVPALTIRGLGDPALASTITELIVKTEAIRAVLVAASVFAAGGPVTEY